MSHKFKKNYKTGCTDTFYEFLNEIAYAQFYVNIHADRDSLTIRLEFNEDDDSAINELYEIADKMGVEVSDVDSTFVFAEDYDDFIAESKKTVEEAKEVIATIAKERDMARKDKEFYRQCFNHKSDQYNRTKKQIEAITVMMQNIFPENNGVQE